MNHTSFKNIHIQLNKLVDRVKDIDIDCITDLEHIKDDPNALFAEIMKQPSYYAYYANLKRVADNKCIELADDIESFKASKLKLVVQHLKLDKVNHITSKLIDAKFAELFNNNELFIKLNDEFVKWSNYKDIVHIALKVVESRENSFKSLSYMMDSMIKTGLMYPVASKRKQLP